MNCVRFKSNQDVLEKLFVFDAVKRNLKRCCRRTSEQ